MARHSFVCEANTRQVLSTESMFDLLMRVCRSERRALLWQFSRLQQKVWKIELLGAIAFVFFFPCRSKLVFLSGGFLPTCAAKVNNIHRLRQVSKELLAKGKKWSLEKTQEVHLLDDNLHICILFPLTLLSSPSSSFFFIFCAGLALECGRPPPAICLALLIF